eukprot:352555-Chlamydomonas_euryale.AAC.4
MHTAVGSWSHAHSRRQLVARTQRRPLVHTSTRAGWCTVYDAMQKGSLCPPHKWSHALRHANRTTICVATRAHLMPHPTHATHLYRCNTPHATAHPAEHRAQPHPHATPSTPQCPYRCHNTPPAATTPRPRPHTARASHLLVERTLPDHDADLGRVRRRVGLLDCLGHRAHLLHRGQLHRRPARLWAATAGAHQTAALLFVLGNLTGS